MIVWDGVAELEKESRHTAKVTGLLPFLSAVAAFGQTLSLRFLAPPAQYPSAESHSVSCVSVLNTKIRKSWRAEQDQEYENIKCSKISLLGGSSHRDRIFGAG
jgi:hypothetical protein